MLQYRNLKHLLLFIVAASVFGMVSCKKNSSSGSGAPIIRQVRAITPKPNDSVLTAALPGQYVVIQGTNLASTQQVIFDGFPSTINNALFSDSNLVVIVPRIAWDSIPNGKLNTLEVITATGSIVYKFVVTAPVPTITSLSNEMALAGATLVINGNNFYGVNKVIFPGGIAVTNFTVSGITQITLTVPTGITTGGPLQVVGTYGIGTSILLFNDFTTGMLTTFDDANYSWGAYEITNSSTLFPANTGKYAHISTAGNIGAGDFAWYDGRRSMNTNGVTWIPSAHMSDPISSYALKFEMNFKKAWAGASIYIVKDYTWTYLARFEPWKTSSVAFTTNGWTTVTIPLTQFKTKANGLDGSGDPAISLTALLGTGNGSLSFMLINSDATAAPVFDGAFDNFRIVKITQ
jgi:hypothetical protein